jgi:hypothetical protein
MHELRPMAAPIMPAKPSIPLCPSYRHRRKASNANRRPSSRGGSQWLTETRDLKRARRNFKLFVRRNDKGGDRGSLCADSCFCLTVRGFLEH